MPLYRNQLTVSCVWRADVNYNRAIYSLAQISAAVSLMYAARQFTFAR